MMIVYVENIIGAWQREDNGSIYQFYKSGNLVVKHGELTEMLEYSIESKNGYSRLRIGKRKVYAFVNVTPKFIALATRSGIVMLNKIVIV